MKRMRIAGVMAALAAAVAFPAVASATPPTREDMPVDTVDVFAGPDSPCPFDLTLTGTGTVTLTTFYDAAGTPVSATVHGALIHTISSPYKSLSTNGPAPVHFDLTTGETVITGNEFLFHVPGDGIVFGQAGRLVVAADGTTQLSFTGRSVVDAPALCAALAP
jgi:hypothetical protein